MTSCFLQGEIRLRYEILQRDAFPPPDNVSNLTLSDLSDLPSFCMCLESAHSCDQICRQKLRERNVEIEKVSEILHFAPNLKR